MSDPVAITLRVLLVDDQRMVAEAVRRMLAGEPDIEFHHVADAALALEAARRLRPALIMQDLVMPGADGLDLIRQYRSDPLLRQVPVMVLSSKNDPRLMAASFERGANDYVIKLPGREELLTRLRYHAAGATNPTTQGKS